MVHFYALAKKKKVHYLTRKSWDIYHASIHKLFDFGMETRDGVEPIMHPLLTKEI